MTDVNVLKMEDGRVEACLIRKGTSIKSWMQMRDEILEITRTQQYADSNLVPTQIGVQPKSKGKDKDGKDARIVRESERRRSEKVLLLQRGRSCKVPEQDEIEGPGRCRVETSDCKLPTK